MAQNLKRFWGQYWLLVLITVASLVIVAVFLITRSLVRDDSQGHVVPSHVDTSTENGGVSATEGDESRLSIRLSEGQSQPQTLEPVPLATGESLSDGEIKQILARLPALVLESEDRVDFNLPEDSLPPPRTGETIEETFPPPPESIKPEPVEAGPLEVLRFAPEGEIPIAPFVNVTFNQPMVPLATIEDLAAENVPVLLEPELPGTWRWLGTKTLTFQYDSALIDRLPMATE